MATSALRPARSLPPLPRPPWQRAGAGVLALSAALALGGCAKVVDSTGQGPTEEPAKAETASPTPTPTPESLGAINETFHVVDVNGYTFDVVVNVSVTDIRRDVTNTKPGFTSAILDTSGSIVIQNTTPGRNLVLKSVPGVIDPLAEPTFLIDAVYGAGTPACNGGPDGCVLGLVFGRMTGGTLPPGESQSIDLYRGRPGQDAGIANVPEDQFEVVREALKHATGYRLIYVAGDIPRFTNVCTGDASKYDALIGASGDGCNVGPRVNQPAG